MTALEAAKVWPVDGDAFDALRHRFSETGQAELVDVIREGQALADQVERWAAGAWTYARLSHELPRAVSIDDDSRLGSDLFGVVARFMGVAEALLDGRPSTATPVWWPCTSDGRMLRPVRAGEGSDVETGS